LFSDGAYEITRPDGSMWTYEAFAEVVRQANGGDGADLDAIVQTITDIRGSDRFEDDVSILKATFS
jgi:sigma-B regulation protein RsbU (phosphoserine phosphatase)